MPLKIESEYDISLKVDREPLYDQNRLNEYAKNKGVCVCDLEEQEKEQFIIGYMSL